jgi:Fe-S-cluster containining protein
MCCDGSIFANAPVEPEEEEPMLSSGLNLFESDGKTYFHQPCPHSQGGRCAIYQTRFHICRTFQCKLLNAVKHGEIGLSEARRKIAFARDLIAQAAELEPQAASHRQRNLIRGRLAKELSESDGAAAEQSRQSLLKLVALEAFLDRWFRNKKALQDDTMRQSDAVDRDQS